MTVDYHRASVVEEGDEKVFYRERERDNLSIVGECIACEFRGAMAVKCLGDPVIMMCHRCHDAAEDVGTVVYVGESQ